MSQQYARIFQIVAVREPIAGVQRFEVKEPASRWTVPKEPTFVAGATASVAVQPACVHFGAHSSDLQLKEVEVGHAFPAKAVYLTPMPTVGEAGVLSEADLEKLREEAYRPLRPKEPEPAELIPTEPSEVPGFVARRTANGARKGNGKR